MRHRLYPFLFAAPLLLASPVEAAPLTVTVSQGNAPVGSTVWTFSGSSTYTESTPGGTFAIVPPLTSIVEWKGDASSDFVKTGAYDNYTPSLTSGLISLTVTPLSGPAKNGTIIALHVDHDTSGDDFGIGLDGASTSPLNTAISLSANDVVSWTGSGIFPVDITKLNYGLFPFSVYSNSPQFGSLPIAIKVQPVPGPLPLLGCGVAFSFARQCRRKALLMKR